MKRLLIVDIIHSFIYNKKMLFDYQLNVNI